MRVENGLTAIALGFTIGACDVPVSDTAGPPKNKLTQPSCLEGWQRILRSRSKLRWIGCSLDGPNTGYAASELQNIMTPNKGPTTDPDWLTANPQFSFDAGWDPRHIRLKNVVQSEYTVFFSGIAQETADVLELTHRLSASPFFYDVRVGPEKRSQDGFEFNIEATIRR